DGRSRPGAEPAEDTAGRPAGAGRRLPVLQLRLSSEGRGYRGSREQTLQPGASERGRAGAYRGERRGRGPAAARRSRRTARAGRGTDSFLGGASGPARCDLHRGAENRCGAGPDPARRSGRGGALYTAHLRSRGARLLSRDRRLPQPRGLAAADRHADRIEPDRPPGDHPRWRSAAGSAVLHRDVRAPEPHGGRVDLMRAEYRISAGLLAGALVLLAGNAGAQQRSVEGFEVLHEREVFDYDAAGRRDPFRSLLLDGELGIRIEDLTLRGV